jgi:hypothetical protein
MSRPHETSTQRHVRRASLLFVATTLCFACAPEAAPTPISPATVATTAAAPPRPPAPPSNATEVLEQNRAPFDACYAHARQQNAGLGRTSVIITFAMDGGGKLQSVELQYRNRFDDASKDCMRVAAETLVFPPSLTGKQVGTIELPAP